MALAIPFYVGFFTMVAVIASRVEISFLLGQLLRSFDFVYLAYWSIVFFVATTIEGTHIFSSIHQLEILVISNSLYFVRAG